MFSGTNREANSEAGDDNETAIPVSIMTENNDTNSEPDFHSNGRCISSSNRGSFFGRMKSSSGVNAELDDLYSDSSVGSYKRYSVWTK